MELIYGLLEMLPFEFLKYDFIKNAIIAIILLAPLFAILGTMIVNNKMAFFSDALGHSALTGIAIRNGIWSIKQYIHDSFCCFVFITFKLCKA